LFPIALIGSFVLRLLYFPIIFNFSENFLDWDNNAIPPANLPEIGMSKINLTRNLDS
jgi:hypothetical protein